jgi:hypothetical protein
MTMIERSIGSLFHGLNGQGAAKLIRALGQRCVTDCSLDRLSVIGRSEKAPDPAGEQ